MTRAFKGDFIMRHLLAAAMIVIAAPAVAQ